MRDWRFWSSAILPRHTGLSSRQFSEYSVLCQRSICNTRVTRDTFTSKSATHKRAKLAAIPPHPQLRDVDRTTSRKSSTIHKCNTYVCRDTREDTRNFWQAALLQMKVCQALLRGDKNVVCSAATGFRKTLSFFMPLLFSKDGVLIIVTALNILGRQNVDQLTAAGTVFFRPKVHANCA